MSSISTFSDISRGRDALLSGDPHAAVAILERTVAAAPADVEARYWLASAKLTARDPHASEAMDNALMLHALAQARALGADVARCRTDAIYATAIATQLYAGKLVCTSGEVRRLALAASELDGHGLLSYGLALQHQGRAEEACQVFRAVAENFPTAAGHQFLIYPQLLCEDGEARHAEAAREWARTYTPAALVAPHKNRPGQGRKLRIGYVAPWFAGAQLKQFIAPLLENHDPEAVSVTLYPTDASTETDWPSWIAIHPIGGLNDAQAATLIRRDGIDVLADCWGHSAGSRLGVFARSPAPVQVAWLNYIQTTGLEQMDYLLHADATETPAGLVTEQVWPIGPVFNTFRPATGRLAPSPTPALMTGQVTFGSFNHPAKLSDVALNGWAAILRAAPESRLLLKYSYFLDPVLCRVTQARFAARGVAPERIVFAGHSSGEEYYRAFRTVDLMLDAWPAPGSTTTLDALSNGVPVLVMAEPTLAGRYARTILEACGLHELVTTSGDDFVARALELVSDVRRLDDLRSRVRPAFDGGPCCDEVGFTRRIEAAFTEMFDLWCDEASEQRARA